MFLGFERSGAIPTRPGKWKGLIANENWGLEIAIRKGCRWENICIK
jgi:hypothetical protein